MKISPLLLCITLAAPVCAHAAPANKPAAPSSAAPNAPAAAPHADGDEHDHAGPKVNEGSLTDYLWRRSDAAFHDGDFPRAVELHRAIVEIDPTDVESYGVGAWLLWSLGEGAKADAFIAQGLKSNPENWEMWDTAAKQYGLEKRYTDERDAYGKAINLAGAEADQMMRRRYAHASEDAGDLNESAKVWRALVAEFPAEAVNKNNLARVEAEITAKGDTKMMGALGFGALMLLGYGALRKRARAAL